MVDMKIEKMYAEVISRRMVVDTANMFANSERVIFERLVVDGKVSWFRVMGMGKSEVTRTDVFDQLEEQYQNWLDENEV